MLKDVREYLQCQYIINKSSNKIMLNIAEFFFKIFTNVFFIGKFSRGKHTIRILVMIETPVPVFNEYASEHKSMMDL